MPVTHAVFCNPQTAQPEVFYYVQRTLCTVLDDVVPAVTPVHFPQDVGDLETWGFEHSDVQRLAVFWTPRKASDASRFIETDVVLSGLRASRVVGIDILYGREQELIVSTEGDSATLTESWLIMRVLIISSNTLPAAPSGPVYLAGAVRQAGHEVQIYERLFAVDLAAELTDQIRNFQPDVVGVSIRLVFGDVLDPAAPLGTRHTDLRPRVKEIVDIVRRVSPARIVLGGPGFNYYSRDWLEYLDLDYGIRGEGEEAFPLYLHRLAEDGDITTMPGCVVKKDGSFHSIPPRPVRDLDAQALPAYDLVDWQPYAERKITPAILTKRGCAFSCTYCPYSKLEGKRYRLKSPERVLTEARTIRQFTGSRKVMFCDNNFNVPRRHAEAICRALIADKQDVQWGTGDLRPMGVTDDFCRLMEDSGCFYANLSIESASEDMLQSMKRGYTLRQVREALETLSRSNIPFGASLMLGAPGETPETIAETLSVLDDYQIPNGVWSTVGVYLWTDYQDIVAEARRTGYLKENKELFSGAVYLSPGLPRSYLRDLPQALRARRGYSVQFNNPGQLLSRRR